MKLIAVFGLLVVVGVAVASILPISLPGGIDDCVDGLIGGATNGLPIPVPVGDIVRLPDAICEVADGLPVPVPVGNIIGGVLPKGGGKKGGPIPGIPGIPGLC